MRRGGVSAVLWGLAGALALPVACETGGVVGGECASGLTECAGECVDLQSDPQNCGKCGNVCPLGAVCAGGVCSAEGGLPDGAGDAADVSTDGDGGGGDAPRPDGVAGDAEGGEAGDAPGDAPRDGAADGFPEDGPTGDGPRDGPTGDGPRDGPTGDGPVGDGPTGDGPTDGPAGDGCAPPYVTPAACGDCRTKCTGSTPVCSPADGSYACVPLCTPPLVDCGGTCVDLNSDPRNCGKCFNVCPTGLCQSGKCVGATVGHEVLFCMDYDRPVKTSPQTTLLANAVFLPLPDPVRILAYDEHSSSANVARVQQALGFAAAARGRTFVLTAASSSSDVVSNLSVIDYEVFLVYDQPNAPSGALGAVGNAVAPTLDAFARAGGTIVVLSSAQGAGEMPAFLDKSGLLATTGQVDATSSILHNRAPADAVGLNVATPFLARRHTCTFTTSQPSSPSSIHVVTDASPDAGPGSPVVVHEIKVP